MFAKSRVGLITAAAMLGIVVAPSAMAAPKEFCKLYATVAVNQSNSANALHLGCFGFRWHNWFDGHYQWCRSTSVEAARSEALVRHRTLAGGQC
ncbi:MAG TPA: hypothetical protein VHK26_11705 [Methyloceanibacter sp.]|jgi:hypothetical protein|nr:hypothetical protein [Methyloceanibacter sp.]